PAPQQPSPNLTGALIVPASTGSTVYVIAPASGALVTFGTPVNTGTNPPGIADLFTDTIGATPASDANDVVSVGGSLYYTDMINDNGVIGASNPTTQITTDYQIPVSPPPPPNGQPIPQQPNQMAVDDNGNIWFTETAVNAVQEFDPATGAF